MYGISPALFCNVHHRLGCKSVSRQDDHEPRNDTTCFFEKSADLLLDFAGSVKRLLLTIFDELNNKAVHLIQVDGLISFNKLHNFARSVLLRHFSRTLSRHAMPERLRNRGKMVHTSRVTQSKRLD